MTSVRYGRRGLLAHAIVMAGGVAASGLLTGCDVDTPTIIGGATTPPARPTPTPPARLLGADQAYAVETALAGQAATVARLKLPTGQRQRVELVRSGHHEHALALAGPTPTSRPTTSPTPAPTAHPTKLPGVGSDPQKAVATLAAQETHAAKAYRTNALATSGVTTLLWGSLWVSATMAHDALGRTTKVTAPKESPRAPLPTLSDTDAVRQLLPQVHAIVFGYRAGIAALDGETRTRADTDLRQRQLLRDALTQLLNARGVTAPAAQAAYRLPVDPTSAARAAQLFCAMEQRLLAFVGLWLAAADEDARRDALAALSDSGRASVSWGGGPRTWPGWPD